MSLVFEDTFASLDNATWSRRTFTEPLSTVNGRTQNGYVPDNVYTDANGLHIRAERSGLVYLTGWLDTVAKKSWLYGYFEARIRWPNVPGIWGGFFSVNEGGWPPEIDAGEVFGNDGALQFTVRQNASKDWATRCVFGPSLFGQWHKFAFSWESGKVVWFIDDQEYWRETNFVPSLPMHLYIVLAMGEWQTPNDALLPATLDVEYVRIWQRKA